MDTRMVHMDVIGRKPPLRCVDVEQQLSLKGEKAEGRSLKILLASALSFSLSHDTQLQHL